MKRLQAVARVSIFWCLQVENISLLALRVAICL